MAEAVAFAPSLPPTAYRAKPVAFESISYHRNGASMTGCAATYWIEGKFGTAYLLRLQYMEASISDASANPSVRASFAYDLGGNVSSITDPLSRVTSTTYNLLNQVTSVTAPLTTGSPAPTTTYLVSAFGDVMREVSPDRGTINYTYDKNSNLLSKTDALSVVTNYTYDALNRLRTVVYPSATTLNITYNYDEAGHGKGIGRLTSVTDPSGSRSLSYDERGAVTADTRVIAGTSYPTSYSYNPAGRLASITYPAGAVAGYTYNTAGNIATVTSTPSGGSATTVANYTAAGYLPFGPPKGLTLGNGVTTSYTYDKDLNLLTILASNSILNLTYGYDNAGNLTSITDALTAANTQTLTYDVLNRITGATSGTGGYGTLAYAWDKNANRTSHTIGGTSTPYTTLTSTNKLTNVGAQAITTNSNGSVTGFAPAQASGLTTLAYDAAGRVATASSASATLTTNTYDATGMRVRKVAGSTTSRFVRGLGAELLQEITGSTRRNYIYANGVPVAQLQGTTLHYLHTDQRGAPVKATNASKTVRWSTRYEPFGATIGLTNPGSLVMNLRLPGQYADSESGLYDNGFRTYNPQTGRYLQSDPIGLAGGTNTYGYVTGNPFRWVDPFGLISQCSDDYCEQIIRRIKEQMKIIDSAHKDLLDDRNDLYNRAYNAPDPTLKTQTTWTGHMKSFDGYKTGLKNLIKEAMKFLCIGIPFGANDYTKIETPTAPLKVTNPPN